MMTSHFQCFVKYLENTLGISLKLQACKQLNGHHIFLRNFFPDTP